MKDHTQELLALLEGAGADLHALLMRLTLRDDVAEELMQELFVKLARSDGFAKATDRKAYAARTAIHLAFDWRRGLKRRPAPAELTAEPTSRDPSPLAKAIEAEQLEQILDAAARLTKLRRDAFVLRFVHSATYEQVGQQLGRSPHQARALCHKAVDRLREILGDGEKEPSDGEH